jgi:kynurenine formamidase
MDRAPGGLRRMWRGACRYDGAGVGRASLRSPGRGGQTVDEIPVERFVGRLVVIDVREEAEADRDDRLTPEAVGAFEARYGMIPPGATVAMYTGWGSRYGDRAAYFGDDTPGDASHLHFPGFGEEAARLLVARGVAAIGLDTPSLDHGPSSDFPAHRVIAAANLLGLENLANLGQLPPTGALIVALAMKIEGGSGAPLRAIAFVPRAGR